MADVVLIRSTASSCRDKLQALRLAESYRSDAPRGAQRATWPDELLARFDYLASDFGLFDTGRFAIDRRLSINQLEWAMALQYLQAISANAEIGASMFRCDKSHRTNCHSVLVVRRYE
jgi:hypothetical protein